MNYKILINESGVPVLVEVPEKPTEARPYSHHVMFRDELRKWREYDEALSAALADKSKHIAFKDESYVKKIILKEFYKGRNTAFNYSFDKNETFDLPENIGVSFESCKMCEGTGQYEKPYQQFIKCNYCSNGKIATLTPITEAPEPEDITIKPVYTSEMKLRVAPVKSEGEESFNAESMPPINTVEEQGYKETTSIISGLQIKIDELKDRKSDYWRGVRDGYQSALDFIVKQDKEELPFGK